MSNELKKHITSDTVKWILTLLAFILVGVMLAGIICGWFDKKDEEITPDTEQSAVIDGDGNAMSGGEIYAMPRAMSFTSTALAATSAGQSVDVQIEATVTPSTAANKLVDYSVAWGAGASRASEAVTNYLTVTQSSDGSTVATVSCKKAFTNDKIIITVTTRDGGYTAQCTVSFVGVASGMTITSADATLKSSTARGSYYELGTNKTYTFNVNLSNVFNTVGSKNLSVSVGGSGTLSFGKRYTNDGGYYNYQDTYTRNINELANQFITSAAISETTLTVKTGSKVMETYYSAYAVDANSYQYAADAYVAELDDYWNIKDASATFYNSTAKANAQLLPSCYFYITVKDSVSGISETVKLWVVSAVSGVSLTSTLSF